MKDIYYWIGAIVFWAVVAVVAGFVLYAVIKWLIEKIWRHTWLYQTISYYRICFRYCKKPYKSPINAEILWKWEGQLLTGSVKHLFKKKLLNYVFPRILELNPDARKRYDEFNEYQKKKREEYLKEKGWGQWYNDDYWINPKMISDKGQDYTNHGMNVWDAYRLQKKWEKEENEN